MNNIRGMLEIRWCSGEESACQCRRRKRHGFYSWVRDNPLEKEMATHSSILAWEIPWTEEPGGLQLQRIRHNWPTEHARTLTHTHTHTHTHTVHADYSFSTHLYWFLLSAKHCPGCQDSKWMRHRLQSVYSHLAAINGPVYKLLYPCALQEFWSRMGSSCQRSCEGKRLFFPILKKFCILSVSLFKQFSGFYVSVCVVY